MTKQDNKYYVMKTDKGVKVELNSKKLLELEASNKTISGKQIMDSIDFVNMESFDFEIDFKKVSNPKPDEVFFNYVWDFFNTFFTGLEDYFKNGKNIDEVELSIDFIE